MTFKLVFTPSFLSPQEAFQHFFDNSTSAKTNASAFSCGWNQGCQIFLGTTKQNCTKRYTKLATKIPNGHKLYQNGDKNTKRPRNAPNLYIHPKAFQNMPKYVVSFGMKPYHPALLVVTSLPFTLVPVLCASTLLISMCTDRWVAWCLAVHWHPASVILCSMKKDERRFFATISRSKKK
jgi:hypothetical protein